MASKKKSTAATSDTSGMSLADFKSKYKPAAVSSATIGAPGKTYVAKGSGPSYVGPTPKGADKGIFAGSSTPLGTSLAGSNLSKGNVAKIAVSLTGAGALGRIVSGAIASSASSKAFQAAKKEALKQPQPPSRPQKIEPLIPKKIENKPSPTRADVDARMYDFMARNAKTLKEEKIYATKRDSILQQKYPKIQRVKPPRVK
jgi:hypothetical protein